VKESKVENPNELQPQETEEIETTEEAEEPIIDERYFERADAIWDRLMSQGLPEDSPRVREVFTLLSEGNANEAEAILKSIEDDKALGFSGEGSTLSPAEETIRRYGEGDTEISEKDFLQAKEEAKTEKLKAQKFDAEKEVQRRLEQLGKGGVGNFVQKEKPEEELIEKEIQRRVAERLKGWAAGAERKSNVDDLSDAEIIRRYGSGDRDITHEMYLKATKRQ
jgi:hypothetical protein